MNVLVFILVVLFESFCFGQTQSKIIIVNIGKCDRVELGKQLRVINDFSPAAIGLDFFLSTDSLAKDSVLVKEIGRGSNIVRIVGLHDLVSEPGIWGRIEGYHEKFGSSHQGFANLIMVDSVIYPGIRTHQVFRTQVLPAFSSVVAERSYGVKPKFTEEGMAEVKLDLRALGKNYRLIERSELYSGSLNKKDFAGKIVLMGYIGSDEDYFYMDRRKRRKVNGVEVHAAIIDQMIKI